MQGKNKTQSQTPKSGDGTQDVKKSGDANWFGASQEPQEEFIHDGDAIRSSDRGERVSRVDSSGSEYDSLSTAANGPSLSTAASTKMSGSDEGVPTFSGTRPPGTPERAGNANSDTTRSTVRGDGFDPERNPSTDRRPTDIDNRH